MTKNSKWLLGLPAIFVIFLIGLVVFTGIKQTKESQQTGRLHVVASLDSYGEIAQAVLGNQGSVRSVLTNPAIDPHDFEPTASTARLYQQADIIISNGGGYDQWSTRLAQANESAKKITVAKLYHYHAGDNEHFWYAPDLANRLTNQLVITYSQLIPAKKPYFEQNAQRYLRKLTKLDQLRSTLKQTLAGQGVLTTEPVFDLTLKSLDANILVPAFGQAIDEGQDPTPAAVQAWRKAIDQGQVKVVIENKQAKGKLVDQAVAYAKEHQVPVVKVTETKGQGQSYLDWQYAQLKQLAKAVGAHDESN